MKKSIFALFLLNNLINASFPGTPDISGYIDDENSLSSGNLETSQELMYTGDSPSNISNHNEFHAISETKTIQDLITETQEQSFNEEAITNLNDEADYDNDELDYILNNYLRYDDILSIIHLENLDDDPDLLKKIEYCNKVMQYCNTFARIIILDSVYVVQQEEGDFFPFACHHLLSGIVNLSK